MLENVVCGCEHDQMCDERERKWVLWVVGGGELWLCVRVMCVIT